MFRLRLLGSAGFSLFLGKFYSAGTIESYANPARARDLHTQKIVQDNFAARNLIKSRQRDEYPHSLSYQASTWTQFVPTTRVYGASTIEECGLPRKSIETSSSSTYCKMPFMGPPAAVLIAALTVATAAGLSVKTVKSTTLTLGVGTRIA